MVQNTGLAVNLQLMARRKSKVVVLFGIAVPEFD
jgi:hypothetical protein